MHFRGIVISLSLLSSFFGRTVLADDTPPPAPNQACSMERSVGISKDDADAIEELVCGEVRSQLPYGGHYRIRVAKLGAKIVIKLIGEKSDGGHAEKQLVLSGLEEIQVATPRLVEALAEQKHVAETQTVLNVVGEEARTPKKKASEVHFWIGMIGAASAMGSGAGAHLALSAGSDRWSFVGDLRAAGGAFTQPAAAALTIFSLGMIEPDPEDKFHYASLSGGVRHHFSSSDTSFFMGAGIAFDYLQAKAPGRDPANLGLAGYGEIGLDLLRTHRVGGALSLRIDAPAFTMKEERYAPSSSGYAMPAGTVTSYTPVVGGGVSLRF